MTGQPPALDKVLSSSGRVRILSLLAEVEEIHLSEIAKRTEQSYSATERHLRDLTSAGIIDEKDYGRVRIFRLKAENPHARMLRDLILQWNNKLEPETSQGSTLNRERRQDTRRKYRNLG